MQIVANGIGIEVDDRGLPGGEPLLLIMGLGMQLVAWPDELVQDLVSRGFRVIRFDNRDIGLSQHLDQFGVPHLGLAVMRQLGLPDDAEHVRETYLAELGRIRGAPDNDYTAGVICGKVARYAERAHHPDRIFGEPFPRVANGADHPEPQI